MNRWIVLVVACAAAAVGGWIARGKYEEQTVEQAYRQAAQLRDAQRAKAVEDLGREFDREMQRAQDRLEGR